MPTFQLGIDVAKAKLDCALRRPNGTFRTKVVANTAEGFAMLLAWLTHHQGRDTHVCLEATGIYWEDVAQFLATEGFTVSVVNPAQIKAYAASRLTRTKTDAVDAHLLAEFCAERHPSPWIARTEAEVTLRALVLRLDALQTMRTQESNRLGVAQAAVRRGLQAHLDWLDQQIQALTGMINEHIDSNPDLRQKRARLARIPGLGERTTAMLLAFYADPSRFRGARQAVAFAGLDPRQRQSGSSLHARPRLSKIGHAFIRKALYMPAMVTLYKTAWGQRFKDRLAHSGKPAKLIIGAMMRKLLQVAFGVLKSGKEFDPALHGA